MPATPGLGWQGHDLVRRAWCEGGRPAQLQHTQASWEGAGGRVGVACLCLELVKVRFVLRASQRVNPASPTIPRWGMRAHRFVRLSSAALEFELQLRDRFPRRLQLTGLISRREECAGHQQKQKCESGQKN